MPHVIRKVAFIPHAVCIVVDTFAVFLVVDPVTFILVFAEIVEDSFAVHHVI